MGSWTAPCASYVCYLHVLIIRSGQHAQRPSQESISNHCQHRDFGGLIEIIAVLRPRNKSLGAGVDTTGLGLFGDLAACGGSATHGRSLRHAGRAAGPVISRLFTPSRAQQAVLDREIDRIPGGARHAESSWGRGPHPVHPTCVTYTY